MLTLLLIAQLSAPVQRSPIGWGEIDVRVLGNEAEVHAIYRPAGGTRGASFQRLDLPCVDVHNLMIRREATPRLAIAEERQGPWTIYNDTTFISGDADVAVYEIHYSVTLRERVARIPIVLPVGSLSARNDQQRRPVRLTVTGTRRIVMPRLADSAGTSIANLVAVPSALHLLTDALPGECPSRALLGSTGSLPTQFSALVATLAVWVLAYLWWVRRSATPEGA